MKGNKESNLIRTNSGRIDPAAERSWAGCC